MPPLRPYQAVELDYLREHKRAILASDPGLGKTRVLLEASEGRTLVVSAAMLKDTWAFEHARWRPELDLTWASYSGLFERTEKRDKQGEPILSTLGRPIRVATPEPKAHLLGFDTVIFDEAHEIKNRDANQSKAALKIAWSAERLYLSTGTPVPNWGHEVFMLLRAIYGPRDRRFSSYWRFVNTWFNVNIEKPKRRGGKEHRVVGDLHPLATWERFATDNGIEGAWIRHERDKVLTDLPPLTLQEVRLDMVPKQRKAYKEFEKDWFTDIEGHELVTWAEGGKYVKLLKLSTGLEAEAPGVQGSAKLDALEALLAERAGRQTLVFGWFRNSIEAGHARAVAMGLRARFIHGGNKREHRATLAAWRAGEVDVLFGSIRLLKEGLTLTEADTVIFIERSAVPSHNEQAMRRIHRLGQTKPCLCIHLVTKGTVDAALTRLLAGKTDQQARAITAFDLISQSSSA